MSGSSRYEGALLELVAVPLPGSPGLTVAGFLAVPTDSTLEAGYDCSLKVLHRANLALLELERNPGVPV